MPKSFFPLHMAAMGDAWQRRLFDAIDAAKARDISYAEMSRKAELGRNFVQQIRQGNREPSVANVMKICDALDISFAYIITGVEMTRADEMAFRQFVRLQRTNPVLLAELLKTLPPESGADN